MPTRQDLSRSGRARRPGTRVPSRIPALIALGGALGGMARYGTGVLLPAGDARFPWATFLINVSGSFLLALLVALAVQSWPPARYVRAFFGVGFLGAFTTFSTLALEIDRRVAAGRVGLAAGYGGASVLAGLAAAVAGLACGRALRKPRVLPAADPLDPEDLGARR